MDSRPGRLSSDEYVAGIQAGNKAVLARAITLVESTLPAHRAQAEELLERLRFSAGSSIRVGITGTPGAGKSTFIESFGAVLIARGHRVAVLAIDPSSEISGGSVLGDKTRMVKLASHVDAYIRPTPSGGSLGGTASRTRECMTLCEAADYDVVLIETVGVGQSEAEVAELTDCLIALVSPVAGDELQAIKRGLLEVVDFLVVNKADGELRSACEVAAQQYRTALALDSSTKTLGRAQVFIASALNNAGIDEIWHAVEQKVEAMKADGSLAARRHSQDRYWLWKNAEGKLLSALSADPKIAALRTELEAEVLVGQISVEAAARKIADAFSRSSP